MKALTKTGGITGLLSAAAMALLLALPSARAQTDGGQPQAPAAASSASSQAEQAEASAQSAQPTEEQIMAHIEQLFRARYPGAPLQGVAPTPFPGLYELQLGSELVYADASMRYLLQGSLIDTEQRKDLTAERMAKLSEVAFDTLPLQLAVKQVRGKGERHIAIFEDPNCGYCKRLHQTLEQMDNVTIHTLLYPILTPDSKVKSRDIWCARDKVGAWRAWMLEGKTPAQADCAAPIDEVLALGRKLNVRGTPTLVFADGSRVSGALPLAELNARLAAATTAAKK